MVEITLDLKDYDKQDTIFERVASRAIVKRDGKYLVVYSKNGDCKFPGGGVEQGESLVEAMIREVKEETGYDVDPSSIRKEPVYKVHEISKGEFEDVFIMDSYYYECDVTEDCSEQNLDAYEAEDEYRPFWFTLEEIRDMNSKVRDIEELRWVKRELLVTTKLIDDMSK
ncbi:MAG: NUDIX domain-containing protein [Lachnospiraceae bacterium]|nr:NUDIX domain-containing protein [Lachnospiraceae bacterium]